MNAKKNLPRSGVVLIVMLLSMTAGSLSLNKVAPVLTEMMQDLHITDSFQGGLLISIFVLSGIFLTLPTGIISSRIGLYPTGIAALAASVLGSLLGLLPLGYWFMLFSRAVEGIGLVVLTTIGPIAVSRFFSGKKLASAMGCLMCFMALGQVAALNLTPLYSSAGSWRGMWWFTTAYAAAMLLVWVFTMRALDCGRTNMRKTVGIGRQLMEGLQNRNMQLISGVLLCYLISQQGCSGFLVTYLSDIRGMSPAAASTVLSAAPAVGIPAGIVVGWISDRVGSRKWPIAVLMACVAVCYWLMPSWPAGSYALLTLLWGIATMGVVGLCFSVSSEAASEDTSAVFTAILNTVQWIGVFLSSIVFGSLKDTLGWNGVFFAMVPLALIAVILAAFLKEKSNKQ